MISPTLGFSPSLDSCDDTPEASNSLILLGVGCSGCDILGASGMVYSSSGWEHVFVMHVGSFVD